MSKNETRGIRWGELLEPMKVKAAEEGSTITSLAKKAVRNYLGLEVDHVPSTEDLKSMRGTICSYPQFTVRWGRIGKALEERAMAEKTTSTEIARRAVGLYLVNGELPKVEEFQRDLERFRGEVAKIGNNLNQITAHMHSEGTIKTTELGQSLLAQTGLYKEMMDLFRRMERKLERQIP